MVNVLLKQPGGDRASGSGQDTAQRGGGQPEPFGTGQAGACRSWRHRMLLRQDGKHASRRAPSPSTRRRSPMLSCDERQTIAWVAHVSPHPCAVGIMLGAMSGDGTGIGARRARVIGRPWVPHGSLTDLKALLYELYLAAGTPTLDQMASWVAEDQELA